MVQKGFTLLEMVVAIAIFAVMSAISYTTLNQFVRTGEALKIRDNETRHLYRTFAMFERDVRFMVQRSIRDGLGETLPALMAFGDGQSNEGELFEITTSLPSIDSNDWHRLQRIGWSFEQNELVRKAWPVLDRDVDSVPRELKLLQDVASVEVNYIGRDAEQDNIRSSPDWEDDKRLPIGMEIIVTLNNERVYRRIVEVGGASI